MAGGIHGKAFQVTVIIIAAVLVVVCLFCMRAVIVPAAANAVGGNVVGAVDTDKSSDLSSVDISGDSLDDITGEYTGYLSVEKVNGSCVSFHCRMTLVASGDDTGTLTITPVEDGGVLYVQANTVDCTWKDGILSFSYDPFGQGQAIQYKVAFSGLEQSDRGDDDGDEEEEDISIIGRYFADDADNGTVYAEMMRL